MEEDNNLDIDPMDESSEKKDKSLFQCDFSMISQHNKMFGNDSDNEDSNGWRIDIPIEIIVISILIIVSYLTLIIVFLVQISPFLFMVILWDANAILQ